MTRKTNRTRVNERREDSSERKEEYSKLSAKEKIEKLDDMFGKGIGATKQRAKLAKAVVREKNIKPKKVKKK